MDIREVRKHNLKLLMDRAFGIGARGAQSRLAERLGKPQNFVSRCLAESGRPGAKTIGEDFAREIERSFGLASYSLDSPLESLHVEGIAMAGKESNVIAVDFTREPDNEGYFTIPRFSISGSMGLGVTPSEGHIDIIRDMTVHLDWLTRRGIHYSKLDNLAIITGDGDSMEGTFSDGASLLIDLGISQIKTDAIYVFSLDGDLFIKRLQRITGKSLSMISDNPIYRPIELKGEQLERMHIHARVLLAWDVKKL